MLGASASFLGTDKNNVLVLGAAKSGKSAFVSAAVTGAFSEGYRPTLGAELFVKDERGGGGGKGERVTLHLWSCGGHERFRPLIQQHYDGVKAAVLVYDMTDAASFEELSFWYNEMVRACPQAKLIIAGTKSDLFEQHAVTVDDGAAQARAWNIPHFACSARTGRNVDSVCRELAALVKVT